MGKRTASSRNETSVLREKQLSILSPVIEGERRAPSSTDVSLAMTPAIKKKRKLYSMTPQHSEVFTPPTDEERDTPGSVVKRQLWTRTKEIVTDQRHSSLTGQPDCIVIVG